MKEKIFLTEDNAKMMITSFLRKHFKARIENATETSLERHLARHRSKHIEKFYSGKKLTEKQFQRMIRDHKELSKCLHDRLEFITLENENHFVNANVYFHFNVEEEIEEIRSLNDTHWRGFFIEMCSMHRESCQHNNAFLVVNIAFHTLVRYVQRMHTVDIKGALCAISNDALVFSAFLGLCNAKINELPESFKIRTSSGVYVVKRRVTNGIDELCLVTFYPDIENKCEVYYNMKGLDMKKDYLKKEIIEVCQRMGTAED